MNKKVLKIFTIMIIGIVLAAMTTTKAYAADTGDILDLTPTSTPTASTTPSLIPSTTPTSTPSTTPSTTPSPVLNTNLNNNNYNTNLPKTGIEDNTLLIVLLALLIFVAVVAYRRFSYYKNI